MSSADGQAVGARTTSVRRRGRVQAVNLFQLPGHTRDREPARSAGGTSFGTTFRELSWRYPLVILGRRAR